MAAQPADFGLPIERENALEVQGFIESPEGDDLPHLRRVNLSAWDMDKALSEQSAKLFTAEAIVETVIQALYQHFGRDWQLGVPDYPRALRQAARMIQDAYTNMDVFALERNFASMQAEQEAQS